VDPALVRHCHGMDAFCARHASFVDQTIGVFDREIEFYVAYLDSIAQIKRAGLRLCYARIANPSKEVYVRDGFDLALAHKLVLENNPVVCSDFYLEEWERILMISGPNQDGQTTFARMFGQLLCSLYPKLRDRITNDFHGIGEAQMVRIPFRL
jgi:DNA mismatch repair protein MutS